MLKRLTPVMVATYVDWLPMVARCVEAQIDASKICPPSPPSPPIFLRLAASTRCEFQFTPTLSPPVDELDARRRGGFQRRGKAKFAPRARPAAEKVGGEGGEWLR